MAFGTVNKPGRSRTADLQNQGPGASVLASKHTVYVMLSPVPILCRGEDHTQGGGAVQVLSFSQGPRMTFQKTEKASDFSGGQ